ncbi:HNH endonuclease [Pleomorphomonas sp. JP5]|uniref:HNH endonuclease n=1 Tax=Pleomorphomonas sp. JP5 TaxID=2942998 RepID=UPI002043500D|nr:HNH endonuclease signature motif containing protein [Pleomorphomonas sp. JP5]MCM5558516.1 HNH endonuclease [Pleomorphomonas sp. JP5]
MTGRTTDEWIGATPDTAIPPRVRVRVFERAGGRCEICGRKLGPADRWQADHTIALVNGGENRERNLRVACDWCHGEKTKTDVAEKAIIHRKRAKHIGAKPKKPWSKWRKRMDGTVELRTVEREN